MRSEVLSIGSELLLGSITDTNATFLAQQFVALGIELRRVTQVGDRQADIVDAMHRALDESDLVVCTGGIGPTPDDLSREAVAQLLGEEMQVVPELEERLRAFFSGRSRAMPEQNLKQATLIPSAQAITNRSGTAPGWWVQSDNKVLILLPGVPREMKTIWQEEIVPRLVGVSGSYVVTETLKTYGLGESTVAEMLGDLLYQSEPTVATYAKTDGVHVVITATGVDERQVTDSLLETSRTVESILQGHIWGREPSTLAGAVVQLLEGSGRSLATEEAATMGLLATQLASTGSRAFVGGSVLAPTTISSDLVLRITDAQTSHEKSSHTARCEVVVREQGRELRREVVQTASAGALPERAAFEALKILHEELIRTGAAIAE